ncbi:hypothetical protein SSX86_010591 [Deinandra increscens subsp. villosa]|uniref:Replication factor A C-terminal domain-containing protein n=1 Tax=Deinandra increscens subsp. villosa TaxID=3103831 RepID=A0AAP0D981_9ASTR
MHAMYRLGDDAVLDKKITLMGCYVFDDYVCQHAPTIMRVASHTAAIKIDSITTITEVEDDNNIPKTWFSFPSPKELADRKDRLEVLSDFIGKVEDIEHIETENNNSLLRITMKDASGEPIIVALWKEIVALVDTEALAATDRVVIAALQSIKVVDFGGDMQLESTAATRVVINPDLEVAHEMAKRFQPPEASTEPRIRYTSKVSQPDKMTLGSLYQEDMRKIYDLPANLVPNSSNLLCLSQDMKYTCEATVTDITPGRTWFFVRCLPCKRTITAGKDGYSCPRHGEAGLKYSKRRIHPDIASLAVLIDAYQCLLSYRYCVNCTLEDASARVHACVFDEGVNTMLGIKCYDMITKQGYSDAAKIPDPVYTLRGMRMVFLLQNGEMSHESILKFTVNRVSQPSANTEQLTSASPAKIMPVLTAPCTPPVLAIKQPVDTPASLGLTPPDMQASQSIGMQQVADSTEPSTEKTRARSAQKQLFPEDETQLESKKTRKDVPQ